MSKKVLIVDDEPNLLVALKDRIELEGYTTTTALNGKIALEEIRRQPPDVIVLDIIMPEMGGFELCRILKTDKDLKKIPIILITASVKDANSRLSVDVSADVYLTKTPDFSELIEAIRKFA